jgi:hypothetical protein
MKLVLALVAVLTATSALPAFAEPNTGGIGARAVAAATPTNGACEAYKNAFQGAVNKQNTATNKHNAGLARDTANYFLGKAALGGCAWAQ